MIAWWEIALPPLLGALIGWGTNVIAIRMLFRPYRPWLRQGWLHGVIPKNQPRLAAAVARVVSRELVDPVAVEARVRAILTPAQLDALLDRLLEAGREFVADPHNRATLAERLAQAVPPAWERVGRGDRLAEGVGWAIDQVASYLDEPATKQAMAQAVSVPLHGWLRERMPPIANLLEPSIEVMAQGVLAKLRFAEMLAGDARALLQASILDRLHHLLAGERAADTQLQIRDALLGLDWDEMLHEARMRAFKARLHAALLGYLDANLGQLVVQAMAHLDVEAIVRGKVAQYPPQDIERIVLEISSRELRVLELLGGVLGLIIGLGQLIPLAWRG